MAGDGKKNKIFRKHKTIGGRGRNQFSPRKKGIPRIPKWVRFTKKNNSKKRGHQKFGKRTDLTGTWWGNPTNWETRLRPGRTIGICGPWNTPEKTTRGPPYFLIETRGAKKKKQTPKNPNFLLARGGGKRKKGIFPPWQKKKGPGEKTKKKKKLTQGLAK